MVLLPQPLCLFPAFASECGGYVLHMDEESCRDVLRVQSSALRYISIAYEGCCEVGGSHRDYTR